MQYITATFAPGEGQPTKKALLAEAISGAILDREFISTSNYHRPGSWFKIGEAIKTYGPVGLQVRRTNGSLVMIEATETKVTIR